MAYSLSLLNYSLLTNITSFCSCHSTCVRPRRFNFPFNAEFSSPQSGNIVCCTQIYDQDSVPESSDGLASSSWKSHIWVNPKSSKHSQLLQQTYEARYDILLQMSKSLDSCEPTEHGVSEVLTRINYLEHQEAIIVLDNMSNANTAWIALDIFLQNLKPMRMTVFYNVAMKVFRKSKNIELTEKLFDKMTQRGVAPDLTTFSTIISTARLCSLPEKAFEWYETMPNFHCYPDAAIYSSIMYAYGLAGNIAMVISMHERAISEEIEIDSKVLTSLIKTHGIEGKIGKCLQIYEGMKSIGVKPSLLTCNNLLIALGRAKMPWHAKTVQKDMSEYGIFPDRETYATLLRLYGRARYDKDMTNVYREMKEKRVKLDLMLYNTILAVYADLGFVTEAVEVFEDMTRSTRMKPDKWTISAMITAYSHNGNVAGAEAMFYRMQEAGIVADLFVLTSLIQCYGKAKCVDKVVRTFHRIMELGTTLDEEFFCCVLHVMSHTPKDELHKIIACVGKAHSKLAELVKLMVDDQTSLSILKMEACKFLEAVSVTMRKAYCNCFVDICSNLNLSTRAAEILDLGIKVGVYRNLLSRTPAQWSLHIVSFSSCAGLMALDSWISGLMASLEKGEGFPPVLRIHTGHGNVTRSVLANAVKTRLEELNAPFSENPEKIGWFMTTGTAAMAWLESRKSREVVVTQ